MMTQLILCAFKNRRILILVGGKQKQKKHELQALKQPYAFM